MAEYIELETVIAELDELKELHQDSAACYVLALAKRAVRKIPAVNVRPVAWIPVMERLPDRKREKFWVCTDTGYQCECRWTNNVFGFGESDRWGWHIMDTPQYAKVVAWRDLPKPYEPPKEE